MLIVTIPNEMEKSNINTDNMSSSFTKLRSIDKSIIKWGQSYHLKLWIQEPDKKNEEKIKEKMPMQPFLLIKWKCWQVKQGKVWNTTPTVLANIAIAGIIHKHFPLSLLVTISIIYHYTKCTKIHPTCKKQTKQLLVIEAAWQNLLYKEHTIWAKAYKHILRLPCKEIKSMNNLLTCTVCSVSAATSVEDNFWSNYSISNQAHQI